MAKFVLDNALIINEGRSYYGYVAVCDKIIDEVGEGRYTGEISDVYDLRGKWILPGVIDTHVHFREPGLTQKADIYHESRAAAAGGVTSFFDMPNCVPATVTRETLTDKWRRAAKDSAINYAFYIGVAPDSLSELEDIDFNLVPGVKVFLGSSTGNMKMDNDNLLDTIFAMPRVISVHSEDQSVLDRNVRSAREKYGYDVPVSLHPVIRSVEACVKCTDAAVTRALKHGTRLHVLHISTADELKFFDKSLPLEQKQFTAEACVQHLWFSDKDYTTLGAKIKCNPAIKSETDRIALLQGVADGTIDVVSTDHAPHLMDDKAGGALQAASGIPLIQYSLLAMLELSAKGYFSAERVVEVMAHNPATLFGIDKRGYIRKGYYADLAVIDPEKSTIVTRDDILSKCAWSPFEGHTFTAKVADTYVNGRTITQGTEPMPLRFT